MPDICIAYKLHLECGKMINLYDWLQAFLSIVDPTEVEEESKRVVNPELQYPFFNNIFYEHCGLKTHLPEQRRISENITKKKNYIKRNLMHFFWTSVFLGT